MLMEYKMYVKYMYKTTYRRHPSLCKTKYVLKNHWKSRLHARIIHFGYFRKKSVKIGKDRNLKQVSYTFLKTQGALRQWSS